MDASNILVDGHVHFYDCYRRDAFFSGARRNFKRAAEDLKFSEAYHGCLLMSETSRDHHFSTWRSNTRAEARIKPKKNAHKRRG